MKEGNESVTTTGGEAVVVEEAKAQTVKVKSERTTVMNDNNDETIEIKDRRSSPTRKAKQVELRSKRRLNSSMGTFDTTKLFKEGNTLATLGVHFGGLCLSTYCTHLVLYTFALGMENRHV